MFRDSDGFGVLVMSLLWYEMTNNCLYHSITFKVRTIVVLRQDTELHRCLV